MSLNSVNTNINAYIALESLASTNAGLSAAQKQVSTGYRVADAADDGASFAVAQKVRSAVSGLTAVNQQLGNVSGLVGVAQTSLTTISNAFTSAKALLVDIANTSTSSDQRSQYVAQYKQLVTQVANALDSSSYNGQSLVGNAETQAGSAFSVVVNENGTQNTIAAQNQTSIATQLANLAGLGGFSRTIISGVATDTFTAATPTDTSAQSTAATALAYSAGSTANFDYFQGLVQTSLNVVGANANFINATITLNNNKIDSLNSGLGSLIDADLTRESAVLQSLQIKQQLGTQALSIANQSPQSLLSLFK